ncbi:ROK family protein [Amycolatopsis sp. A133]|uniref:ROK family protein n=1 Tax=Amycolatopsis sp. A133 TaxID=3064472 RepID=UPI0027E8F388|nr:ROK family protein [Amycolatopsis sp. A133]MDQ7810745.1 ROK family protein [Amycolatopsis sp. A133]
MGTLGRGNRSLLLRSLYFSAPASRHTLATATGLSAASVGKVVRELVGEGVVIEAGSLDSNGGRPQRLLRIAPGYGHVVGVDVDEARLRVGLFDLSMTELARADHPLDPRRHGPEAVVSRILAGLTSVLAESAVPRDTILGVGLGVPGAVRQTPEVTVNSQTFGWEMVPLERLLRGGTDLALHIDNRANAVGRAELGFGNRERPSVVVALLGSSVGAGIISDVHGASAGAGELGHTVLVAGGRSCRCGSKGCLEAYVGAGAILDRFREAGGIVANDADQEAALATVVYDDQGTGILAETCRHLGAAIGGLINLLNPSRLILGGWAGLLLGERNLDAIRDAACLHSLKRCFAATSIDLCRLGPDAAVRGAATLPVERFLND